MAKGEKKITVQQALQLFDTDPQQGYQDAAKVLREHISQLNNELAWAWDNLKFLEYHGEDAEYEFCRECHEPEFMHSLDCAALKHQHQAEDLLGKPRSKQWINQEIKS